MAELDPQQTKEILKGWHDQIVMIDTLIHNLHREIQEVYKQAHESLD